MAMEVSLRLDLAGEVVSAGVVAAEIVGEADPGGVEVQEVRHVVGVVHVVVSGSTHVLWMRRTGTARQKKMELWTPAWARHSVACLLALEKFVPNVVAGEHREEDRAAVETAVGAAEADLDALTSHFEHICKFCGQFVLIFHFWGYPGKIDFVWNQHCNHYFYDQLISFSRASVSCVGNLHTLRKLYMHTFFSKRIFL